MNDSHVEFSLSMGEIDRRREAYTRLVLFIALGSVASSLDPLVASPLIVGGLLLCLLVLLFVSRALFMRSFARYGHTVWSLSDSQLARSDETSRDEHALGDVERLRVKRTVSGDIRAIEVSIRHSRSLYVNALKEPQTFVDELVSRCDHDLGLTEIREPVDYDNPWFYRLLGLAIGVAVTSVVRIAVSTSASDATWIYLGVAVYMVAFGAYWLHGMPISRSYGQHRRIVDVALGLAALGAGVGLGILALAV